MLNLQLEIYEDRKPTSYKIPLGHRSYKTFKTKKKAEKYIYQIKKIVKDYVSLLSKIQSNLYTTYRAYYLQLSSFANNEILSSLHLFDDRIDFVFTNYGHGNSGFAMTEITNLFVSIENTCNYLLSFSKKRKLQSLKYELYAFLKQIDVLEISFSRDIRNLDKSLCYRENKLPNVLKLKTS